MEGEENEGGRRGTVRFSVREGSVMGQARRSSVFGVGARRKSSVSCFMDYEATTKAFLDSQVKLSQSARVLAELESKHLELRQNYDALHGRYL